jgi:thiol-disulfide isomerase/thioredoxin
MARSSSSSRVHLGLVAALMLSAASDLAAGAPSARELEILKRTAASYRRLSSYVIAGSIHVDLVAGERTQTMDAAMMAAGEAPGRIRDEIRHPQMGSLVVSDGRQVWQYVARAGQYTVTKADSVAGDTVAFASPLSANLLPTYRALAEDVETATLKDDETLETAAGPRRCWVIEVTYKREGSGGTVELPRTYWIDQRRHVVLRHRVGMRAQNPQGGAIDQTETMTFDRVALNAGAPDSLFTFRAPEGARKVDSFEAPRPQHADLSGQEASDFTLADLEGRKHSLKAQRGRVVMLDFWATWCGPCRMQMPNVDKLHKEFHDKGLVVYAINQQESADKARRYLDKYKYTTTTLLDSDGQVGNSYKVTGIPSLVVIDREGKIAAHMVGVHSEADLRKALRKAGLEMPGTDVPTDPGRP